MQRLKLSISLIVASLLLLAGFLSWFLKNAYDQEVAGLQKETGYLFVNSIRGIEGEMLDKMLFKSIEEIPDTFRNGIVDRRVKIIADTAHSFSFIGENIARQLGDTTVQVTVMTDGRSGSISELEGSLSIFLSLDDPHQLHDSIATRSRIPDMVGKMEKNFASSMSQANLPIKYKVVKLQSDSLVNSNVLGTGTYTDLVSGHKYGVELSGFNRYILQKLWPEILLSLGLFACVSFAFFTIIKSLKAQQRLTDLKNDFIRNVTHELKTPIATVGVAIEALQDFDAIKNPAKTKEYLDISKNELSRLSMLVDKVLRMSLFEKTAPELKLEPVRLDNLVEEVLSSMKLQFEKKEAVVNINKEGENFQLYGDRIHLTSVVYNLIDNALKYSNGQAKIDVSLFGQHNEITLKVADNGIGIPIEFKEKIFDKFFRVPTGDKHNVKGHGLGLSYVASVVRQHRGKIDLESQLGEGTTFTIKFERNSKV